MADRPVSADHKADVCERCERQDAQGCRGRLHGCVTAGEGRLHPLVPPQRVPAVDLAVLQGAAGAGARAATSACSRLQIK